jgi:hypothetical protein
MPTDTSPFDALVQLIGDTAEGPEGGLSPLGREQGTQFLDRQTGRRWTVVLAGIVPSWLLG